MQPPVQPYAYRARKKSGTFNPAACAELEKKSMSGALSAYSDVVVTVSFNCNYQSNMSLK